MNSMLGATSHPATSFARLPALPSGARAQQPALALCAIGLFGLGILSLIFGDFALGWQPVAEWIPGRTALAYIVGALECLTAIGLLVPVTTRWAVRILFPGVILWQMLKLPALVAAPSVEGSYLGFGELAILLAGGLSLFAVLAGLEPGSPLRALTGPGALRVARLYLGVWIIPIGISHFIYHDATMHLIPSWIPGHSFFAYLTGAGQIASGLGLLANVLPRVAAYAQAGQIFLYTVLIWIPAAANPGSPDMVAVFGKADSHLVCTALFISWFMGASALAVAQNVPRKQGSLNLGHHR
jgi:uncharacterized membrane protein